jgi:hypothetical protein
LVVEELKKEKKQYENLLKKRLWSQEVFENILNLHEDTVTLNENINITKALTGEYFDEYKKFYDYPIGDFVCVCTRCREIRNKKEDVSDKDFIKNQVILAIRKYKSSV